MHILLRDRSMHMKVDCTALEAASSAHAARVAIAEQNNQQQAELNQLKVVIFLFHVHPNPRRKNSRDVRNRRSTWASNKAEPRHYSAKITKDTGAEEMWRDVQHRAARGRGGGSFTRRTAGPKMAPHSSFSHAPLADLPNVNVALAWTWACLLSLLILADILSTDWVTLRTVHQIMWLFVFSRGKLSNYWLNDT